MTPQGPIITAPGSFQSELGCAADWSPACMRPWLQDPDGDGTYTWSTDQIPAGSYEFKVAHGLSWDENYGDGGNNVALSVPSDGTVVTISYVLATHQISVKTSRAGSAPDLSKAKAVWVAKDLRGLARDVGPDGTDPASLRWRLHWSLDRRPGRGRRGRHRRLEREPAATTPPGCLRRSSPPTPSSRATSPCGCRGAPPGRRRTSCGVRWPWGCTTPWAG